MATAIGLDFPVDVGLLSNKEFGELVSITAETLAELARENGERINWDDAHDIVFVYLPNENVVFWEPQKVGANVLRNKDEPLGEFFLRVAKERGYLDKK